MSKGNSDSYVQLKLEFFSTLLPLSLSSVLSSAYSLWPFVCSAAGKLFIILSTNACSSWTAPEKDLEQEQGMKGELN